MDDVQVARCPRCKGAPPLVVGYGALHEDVCIDCRGRFLPSEGVERLLVEEHGLSRVMLRELTSLFASKERIPCPACSSKMSALVLRSVRVDLCTGCGGCWLDEGELGKLGEGRYAELTPAPQPTPPTTMLPRSSGGGGGFTRANTGAPRFGAGVVRCAVLLTSLDTLDKAKLAAAFLRCPGLTEMDAEALLRHNNGVVVDGVSAETAAQIAAALELQGIKAAVADDSWTSLVPAVSTNAFASTDVGLRLGRDPPEVVPWTRVAVIAAGVTKRSSMKQGGTLRDRDVELVIVEADDAFFEALLLDPVARVRCTLSTTIFGDESRGRERGPLFMERIAEVARAATERFDVKGATATRTALGRGIRACLSGAPLPRYRSLRDLEREEAWLLWRHFGPGALLPSSP